MYCLEVHDILHANQTGIQKLINQFNKGTGQKTLKMQDCMKLFTQHAAVITEKDFPFIYGMSKMTNHNESYNHAQYTRLQPVEFLEVICRAADLKYSESSGVPLSVKLEFMLDALFRVVGCERQPVVIEIEE
jgi:hypothetical protein